MAWDEKLNDVIKRAELVNKKLSSSGLSSQELQKYSKEFGTLEPMVKKIKQYKELVSNMNNAKQMLNDSDKEMAEMAKQEFETAKQELPVIEQELKIMMLPKDEADERNVIVEIRAGAGGDEAGLFAGEILRMYQRYAEIKGWKAEVIEYNETDLGGYNFVSLEISGNNVYGTMKYNLGGIAFNEYLKQKAVDEFTHRRQLLLFYQRQRMWILILTHQTFVLIHTAHQEPVDSM